MSTFAQMKSNVSKELGLDETASGDEDVLLGRRLNQAVREFLIETRCYVTTTTLTSSANPSWMRPTCGSAMNAVWATSTSKSCTKVSWLAP